MNFTILLAILLTPQFSQADNNPPKEKDKEIVSPKSKVTLENIALLSVGVPTEMMGISSFPWSALGMLQFKRITSIELESDAPNVPLVAEIPESKALRYKGVLKSDNALVRKRGLLIIKEMGEEGMEVIPLLFRMAQTELDKKNKVLVLDILDEFTTPQKIEIMIKSVKNPMAESLERIGACQSIPFLYLNKNAGDSDREKIKEALKEAIIDADAEIQLEVAKALEKLDFIDAQKKTISKNDKGLDKEDRTKVRFVLNKELLEKQNITAEEILKALQKNKKNWTSTLVNPTTIQVNLSADDSPRDLEEFVFQKGGIVVLLRDLQMSN